MVMFFPGFLRRVSSFVFVVPVRFFCLSLHDDAFMLVLVLVLLVLLVLVLVLLVLLVLVLVLPLPLPLLPMPCCCCCCCCCCCHDAAAAASALPTRFLHSSSRIKPDGSTAMQYALPYIPGTCVLDFQICTAPADLESRPRAPQRVGLGLGLGLGLELGLGLVSGLGSGWYGQRNRRFVRTCTWGEPPYINRYRIYVQI